MKSLGWFNIFVLGGAIVMSQLAIAQIQDNNTAQIPDAATDPRIDPQIRAFGRAEQGQQSLLGVAPA